MGLHGVAALHRPLFPRPAPSRRRPRAPAMATPVASPSVPPASKAVSLWRRYAQAPSAAPHDAATAKGAPDAYTEPPTQRTAGASAARRVGCCGRCFRAHTVEEAGLSFWVHPYVLAATRFFSAIVLVIMASLLIIGGSGLILPKWVTLMEVISFLLLGVSSVLASRGRNAKVLASVAVPVYQTAATCALLSFPYTVYSEVFYWHPGFVLNFIPQVFLFHLDAIVLGARVCFRYVYIWFSVALITANIFLRIGMSGFDIRHDIVYFIISIILVVVAGIIVTAITRLTACIAAGEAEELAGQVSISV